MTRTRLRSFSLSSPWIVEPDLFENRPAARTAG
jgi:hypothetical protein